MAAVAAELAALFRRADRGRAGSGAPGSSRRELDADPWADLTVFGEHNDLTERTRCISCPLSKLKAIVVHGLGVRFDPDLPLRAGSERIRK